MQTIFAKRVKLEFVAVAFMMMGVLGLEPKDRAKLWILFLFGLLYPIAKPTLLLQGMTLLELLVFYTDDGE